MVSAAEYFIVRKDKNWLMTKRNDVLEMPFRLAFSANLYDAARFETKFDAKRMARHIGGELYSFVPATGKAVSLEHPIPKDARCDNCMGYTPYDGVCRNGESEYYKVAVSSVDVCVDWEGKG